MAALSRRSRRDMNTWPGFVDALATILMVIIFLLMIFVIAQFFLNEAISGRDEALESLESQVSKLADMLALERKTTGNLRTDVEQMSRALQASVTAQDDMRSSIRALTTRAEASEDQTQNLSILLDTAQSENEANVAKINSLLEQESALQALKAELEKEIGAMAGQVEQSEGALLAEKELSASARAEVALLTQQTAALRQQLAEISLALDVSETLNQEQEVQIHSLSQRLNMALATKIHELGRYRSEFFGRLSEILDETRGVHVVGDRFVLQSELLFEQGSADLGINGQDQMKRLARTLHEISVKIPDDIDWVLRVDGHTDSIPINTARYPSNWELSAARAISMVRFLIAEGLPANRLAATGFGEYQPLVAGTSADAMQRNRRIELKLTER